MTRMRYWKKWMLAGLVLAVLLFLFAPVAWLVISSISTRTELLSMPIFLATPS